MSNYLRGDVVLVRYPFTDLSRAKVRPALVVSTSHPSADIVIVPLTSKVASLLPGEFILTDWTQAGLIVPTAVKRGIYTVHETLIIKLVGQITTDDSDRVEESLRLWLGL